MNRGETFRAYFRRARGDPAARAHLLATATYCRSAFGWLVLVFGVLAIGQTGLQLLRGGVWLSRASVFYTFCFTVNWLLYDKFGDRIAALAALDDAPGGAPPP